MGALIIGLAGLVTVAIAGTISSRRSKTSDERWFHIGHNFTFCLSFLAFFVVPGVFASLGHIDDPLFGPGPTFPLVPVLIGVVGVLAISIAGAFALQRNTIPAKRGFLIRFHVYMAVTFLLFFSLPGSTAFWLGAVNQSPNL